MLKSPLATFTAAHGRLNIAPRALGRRYARVTGLLAASRSPPNKFPIPQSRGQKCGAAWPAMMARSNMPAEYRAEEKARLPLAADDARLEERNVRD